MDSQKTGLGTPQEKYQWMLDNLEYFDNPDDIKRRAEWVFSDEFKEEELRQSESNLKILKAAPKLLKANNNANGADIYNKTPPRVVDYESQLGFSPRQRFGTCYAQAAVKVIQAWYWRRTGEFLPITQFEIEDLAGDYKNSTYDERKNEKTQYNSVSSGWPGGAITKALLYNDNLNNHYFTQQEYSTNFAKFRDLVYKLNGNSAGLLHAFNDINIKDNYNPAIVKQILNMYGPVSWTLTTDTKDEPGGGHAVTLCKADNNGVYLRNSHGSQALRHISWENLKNECNNPDATGWHLTNGFDGIDVGFAVPYKNLT